LTGGTCKIKLVKSERRAAAEDNGAGEDVWLPAWGKNLGALRRAGRGMGRDTTARGTGGGVVLDRDGNGSARCGGVGARGGGAPFRASGFHAIRLCTREMGLD